MIRTDLPHVEGKELLIAKLPLKQSITEFQHTKSY